MWNPGGALVVALALVVAGAVGGARQAPDRLAAVHERAPFVDMHAHPSRFHRANVPRIEADELGRYRSSLMDVVVANISTDAIYSGRFTQADGTEIPARQYRPKPGEAFAFTMERFGKILKTVEDGDAVLALGPDVVSEARAQGRLTVLAALEGADGLEGQIDHLYELHRRGLRLLQLVHFRANELGHIQTYPYSPGGLTEFGREVVHQANRLGIILDLAHANTETIMDTVKLSRAPVLFSHTGAKALHDLDRALSDDEIKVIAARGGVIGIWPNGESLKEMADMVRHIDYVRRLVGINHVGIGSDLRGMSAYTNGFGEEANFRAIAEALFAAGYTDDEAGKVMGGNFMRVWEQALKEAHP
jgi:membrane dipeptidase